MAEQRAIEAADELRTVVAALRRRLRREGSTGDYSDSQLTAISLLAKSGQATVTTLANAEKMRPQSMGATIAALEATGVVVGSPHPTDGRQTIWTLSPAALQEYSAGRAARASWLSSAVSSTLTEGELDELSRSVAALRRMLDQN